MFFHESRALHSRGDSLFQSAFLHRLILAELFQVDNLGACFGSIDLKDLLLSLFTLRHRHKHKL